MVNHLFTTPVLRDATQLAAVDLAESRDYLLALRRQSPGEERSNRGGWHSQGNLFAEEFRQFPALREAITRALFAYVGEVFGYSGEIALSLTGWAVINHPGDCNVIHNHAANLLSGALYIAVPADMSGGAIVFQDPRLNLNAHETPEMRRLALRPPWAEPIIDVTPNAGEILIFPSWLNHYVEPFTSAAPDAARIVVSFNASV